MKRFNLILNIILLTFIVFGTSLFAQSQRSLNNKGVEQYDKGKFADAEVNFKKSVDKNPKDFTTNFNLGDAYYKQQNYKDAIKAYQSALAESKSNDEKAKVYHNIGNSLLKSKQIEQSINAYKNSLRLNPNDDQTKYNLSYALSLLKNQKKNQKQDKNNKNNKNQKDKNKTAESE